METLATTTDVADDIVLLILSLLPAKSLLRFRAVCRSWRDMISDPRFLRMHLGQSKRRLSQNLFVRIPSSFDPSIPGPRPFSSARVGDGGFQLESDLGSPGGGRWEAVQCTCDGVVLLTDFGLGYMLWNPFTKKKALVPDHPHKFYASSSFGICYDPITMDDFKVVAISHEYYAVHSCGSWSDKKRYPYSIINVNPGPGIWILADGVIYWALRNNEGFREIVCFDRSNDGFKTLPRPEHVKAGIEFELVCLRGCLCLYYEQGDQIRIWVKEEETATRAAAAAACWKQLLVVENVQCLMPLRHNRPKCFLENNRIRPICFLENNRIVMLLDGGRGCVVYSPCEKTFRQLEVTEHWRSSPCVQSLLFPSTINA